MRSIAFANSLMGVVDVAIHCTSTGADCTNMGELSLYAAQAGNEAFWSFAYATIYAASGVGIGAAAGGALGAMFAVVGAGPGAAIGSVTGGIMGAGLGAMAGAATGRGMNTGIERHWRRNGWID
ncbi:hypothetical protein AB1046_18700 [Promicromonospora sp. Populi]|uniref:hypothetical protein n=1 Tax=Promicromonospora sp. Populi TaxID=3239420 RepID=UPI0034E1F180